MLLSQARDSALILQTILLNLTESTVLLSQLLLPQLFALLVNDQVLLRLPLCSTSKGLEI